ncbi:MAG TPA: hypothetical protein VIW23_13490 [Candidatus Acidoferrum sp.]
MTDTSNEVESSRFPTIVEVYRNFEPPPSLKRDVEMLVSYVPQKYLVGLKTIILTNKAGMTRDKRRQKVWSRNHKILLSDARGSYSAATRSSAASVSLYVDNIVESDPDWFRTLPVFGHGTLAHVLYHEIGHHIHRAIRPVYKEKEDVADDWSGRLWGNFCRKHYWYMFPLLWLLARAASPIAKRLKRRTR